MTDEELDAYAEALVQDWDAPTADQITEVQALLTAPDWRGRRAA